MHGHMNIKYITMHGHINIKYITMHGHINIKFNILFLSNSLNKTCNLKNVARQLRIAHAL
jgi:hypothetical protein